MRHNGGEGAGLYKLKKNKLSNYKSIWSGHESLESDKMIYEYSNGSKSMRRISKKKFEGLRKKYFAQDTIKEYKFHDNTDRNRKKYVN